MSDTKYTVILAIQVHGTSQGEAEATLKRYLIHCDEVCGYHHPDRSELPENIDD